MNLFFTLNELSRIVTDKLILSLLKTKSTLKQFQIKLSSSSEINKLEQSVLMVKAEILKYLMHFRDQTADQIIACVIMYLKTLSTDYQ